MEEEKKEQTKEIRNSWNKKKTVIISTTMFVFGYLFGKSIGTRRIIISNTRTF